MVDLAKNDGHKLMFIFLESKGYNEDACGQEVACTLTICIFVEMSGTHDCNICDRKHGLCCCSHGWGPRSILTDERIVWTP